MQTLTFFTNGSRRALAGILAALALLGSGSLWARATPEQVASLGGDTYTPVGAERAGNAAGTIPEWQNGLANPPEGNIQKEGLRDPFAGDQELFRITAANLEEHRQHLSDGQVALPPRYPHSWTPFATPRPKRTWFPEAMVW